MVTGPSQLLIVASTVGYLRNEAWAMRDGDGHLLSVGWASFCHRVHDLDAKISTGYQAALRTSGAGGWIDVNACNQRKIDHHAAVGCRPSGDIVTACAAATSNCLSRATMMASAMSATPGQRAISAGRLSTRPLWTSLAS